MYLHRLVQPLPPGFDVIDHRNGDKLDNRRQNLIPATWGTNARNHIARSNTGHLGISKQAKGGYRATVMTPEGPIAKTHKTIPVAIEWRDRQNRIHHPEDYV